MLLKTFAPAVAVISRTPGHLTRILPPPKMAAGY